jgi:hypothetical protein
MFLKLVESNMELPVYIGELLDELVWEVRDISRYLRCLK